MLQKPKVPWGSILTSLPMIALIIVHCGQTWGFYMFMTELPTYMNEILKFDVKNVSQQV